MNEVIPTIETSEHTDIKEKPTHETCSPALENDFEEVRLSAKQAKLLSDVQISVGVEIGQLCLSAEALLDLLPGQIFEFEFNPDIPVQLRVGEEKIAEAHLVESEDGLALEICTIGEES